MLFGMSSSVNVWHSLAGIDFRTWMRRLHMEVKLRTPRHNFATRSDCWRQGKLRPQEVGMTEARAQLTCAFMIHGFA